MSNYVGSEATGQTIAYTIDGTDGTTGCYAEDGTLLQVVTTQPLTPTLERNQREPD